MIYPGPTYTDLIKEVFSNKQPFYQRMLFFSEPEVSYQIVDDPISFPLIGLICRK